MIALSFDPHPAAILRPAAMPGRLTTFADRRRLLCAAGADQVDRLDPAAGILALTPKEFVDHVVETYRPSVIVEGPDFGFGAGRSGNVDTLNELAADHGIRVIIEPPVEAVLTNQYPVRVSSTRIRSMITSGRVMDAAILLGRPYELTGRVKRGAARGRTIGFPTANVDSDDLLVPREGVYAGRATDPTGVSHAAAISIGTNPTVTNAASRVVEVHLLDFTGSNDEYDWPITVQFEHWIRSTVRFNGVDALTRQIARDCHRIRSFAGQPNGQPTN